MKANELMIGDWVLTLESTHKEKVYAQIWAIEEGQTSILVKIDNCNWFVDIEWIEPIPLTLEIYDKNFRGYKRGSGALAYFVYELNEDYFIHASAGGIDFCMHYDDSEHAAHDDIYLVELKYVHTLQHALRLFGFDKEIVL